MLKLSEVLKGTLLYLNTKLYEKNCTGTVTLPYTSQIKIKTSETNSKTMRWSPVVRIFYERYKFPFLYLHQVEDGSLCFV